MPVGEAADAVAADAVAAAAATPAAVGPPSPDGKWTIILRDKSETRPDDRRRSTDFEKRHEERFKGVMFDWMEFQRDGAAVPRAESDAPHRAAGRPAARRRQRPRDVLVDQDLRPANIAWHPDGKLIAFVADPDWRDEIKYEQPDSGWSRRSTARSRG